MDPPPPSASPAKDESAPPPLEKGSLPAPPLLHAIPPSSSSGEREFEDGRTLGSSECLGGGAVNFMSRPRLRTAAYMADGKPENVKGHFRMLIKRCLTKKHAKNGHYYPFTSLEVRGVIKYAKAILSAEPPLIEMKVPCVVIGDLHGQFVDLNRIFEMFAKDERPGYVTTRYVFLGDYVDRGRQSLEIVMVLFMLKVLYPKQFALLRGNHECRAINKAYGFYAEIKERFLDPRNALDIFDQFNDLFTHLPYACLVANNILCMHGGISSKMKSRDDLKQLPKPLKDVASNQLATDLLWADPMEGLPGEVPNKVRGVSVYFGEATLDQCLADLKIGMIIRGHQMMMNGFNFFHNKLITVFSAAAYYPDKPNRGAVCIVDSSGRVGFKVIVPFKNDHPEAKPKLFRGDHDGSNDFDTGYVKVAPGVVKKPQEESSGEKEEKPKGPQ